MIKAIRITDPESGASASIAPQLGFNCFEFKAVINRKKISVIDSPVDVKTGNASPNSFGIPLLFPYPNRIRDGKFAWEEVEYELPITTDPKNAIHGLCLDRPWRVIEKTKQSVTGQFHLSVDAPDRLSCWPADFIIDVRYRVAENRLETQFRITNPDTKPLPWGLGTHAYFRLPFGEQSAPTDCLATALVSEEWELVDYLPTGRRLPVENQAPIRNGARYGVERFDNVYTGWHSDGGTVRTSIIDEKAGIELSQVCDAEHFREMVVYTPNDRHAICMEPYTCVTDAINLKSRDCSEGLKVLPPGKIAQTWCALQVSPVYA
ncbi:aldose 1-epimerase [Planctomicrobium sp. SH668]|uniref:aldose 1-epimerase n=1 Tax=Planctomicrobium sp. SH668 TaxID=3448126 RepID=UPI003F5B72D4